ncbi:MAG: ABC transporter permease [Bacteroidales bacterium]|jgi:putative ABC transport system permease protein|nr:ABC transporter permease [Bacteroidales bacterium]MDD2264348.1 ABC transporter permease [Bacteroidales bacterium]MDD2831582.1 ABC transporter permease [Bacteroidales bacterium]MDD3209449.1 ABC transporter permease [Bacteroidales bacterium]MDD3697568.1 ABC transporter permease [Bacteroidales bacterium]
MNIFFINRYIHDIYIAVESIVHNKLKSFLTALGIVFGVGAVISMMAIGNGAQQEILDQIKMVGVNNIVILPATVEDIDEESSGSSASQAKKFSPGLQLSDAEAIRKILPSVKHVSPEVSVFTYITYNGIRQPAKVLGVTSEYFQLYNIGLVSGSYFSQEQELNSMAVCIIGHNVKTRFFQQNEAIGQFIKFGANWVKVVGVLEQSASEAIKPAEEEESSGTASTARSGSLGTIGSESMGMQGYDDQVFIPIRTMLLRQENRALAITNPVSSSGGTVVMGGGGRHRIVISNNSSSTTSGSTNYHQLDRITVQVQETDQLTSSQEVITRMLRRRHQEVPDFEVTVPELLLKQQQRTKDIFNIVLGAIAGISLLVGGIGIMNIMFASVMERTKEIGTRLAIGAKKADVIAQFLSEAILISVAGGAIGVAVGVVLSILIRSFFDITTIVSFSSIVISFGVSAAVGVIFGYSPAKRAAERDPIESLRYE